MEDLDLNCLKALLRCSSLIEESQTKTLITPEQRRVYDLVISGKIKTEIVRLGSL